MMKIAYTKPSITSLEISYVEDAIRNGWGASCYDYIHKFEKSFKDHLGVDYAIATSSCTGALHMGLAALGIGRGDEVILADTNWIASVAPVVHLGATPVFVDILEDTWCIDPRQIEAAVTKDTKAIIAVHLYGNLCDMNQILRIADKYDLAVIEDSAEAIGSSYFGNSAGSIGDFGVFSFHGTKTMTTGEGGMFVTNDQALFDKVLTFSNHGRSSIESRQFWAESIGYKYKISNIQAALGCAQAERLEELVQRKKQIFTYYYDNLHSLEGITLNPKKYGCESGYWMPNIVFDQKLGISRELLIRTFQQNDIDARVFFWPLSALDVFNSKNNTPNAYSISARACNLPSYHDITFSEQDRVVDVIRSLL
ncbi:pyridoxal phosphate-dependent aspartate aminotransferase [Oleiphilus messinensis]|uniref:Pyridoxal phosphate-dependent aspartate aminotransferase n=1 Tax=Oleiphilus messinensis TaxID=141451 RepID=A0A1Y0I697_9GAMM|nr:DegT/DnrJ/EryC1/StrS aminotransferase family protein [Oleiphilus messinensis]ARU56012.1 pyridoxal phosphate-dependent aspartate aminotransferase [Oleiphilus messinensis]